MLLTHGAEDTNVPLGQAEYLHRALRHFDVPHEYVVYPREGHSIRERGHQLDVLRRTEHGSTDGSADRGNPGAVGRVFPLSEREERR